MGRFQDFENHVASGGKVESTDWMPDEYRDVVLRTVSFQAFSEIVGSLAFARFLPSAPSLTGKLILTAKIQDEIGHSHILMRVCEDLGRSREEIVEGGRRGDIPLLAYFQYEPADWHAFAVDCLAGTPAAILQFQSLSQGSYEPYNRALRKIMQEESFHFHRAWDLVRTLWAKGTTEQRHRMQDALDVWWYRTLGGFIGPPDRERPRSSAQRWRIKVDLNDDLRQRWFDRVVPIFTDIGFTIPDDDLVKDADGVWHYTEPDWEELRQVTRYRNSYGNELFAQTMQEFDRFADVRNATQQPGSTGRHLLPAAAAPIGEDIPQTGH